MRNPFDRLVSCWLNKIVNRNSNRFNVDDETLKQIQEFSGFVEFVETLELEDGDVHLKPQWSNIDLSAIDYLGRMETFSDDLNHVFEAIGVNVATLENKNVTKSRKPYQSYYSDADVDRVCKLYQKDCQVFGYQFLVN